MIESGYETMNFFILIVVSCSSTEATLKPQTHLVIVNGVLVETTDIVVLLHLLALAGTTLFEGDQQFSFSAAQS